MRYHTAHGYTVEARRFGLEVDLITRDAKGEVVSTVVMNAADANSLLLNLTKVV